MAKCGASSRSQFNSNWRNATLEQIESARGITKTAGGRERERESANSAQFVSFRMFTGVWSCTFLFVLLPANVVHRSGCCLIAIGATQR